MHALAGFVRLQQQRLISDMHSRQGGGDVHGRNIVFHPVLLQQTLHELQIAGRQGVGDALLEIGDALVVDHFRGRQLQRLDLLAGRVFDRRQHAPLAGRDKQDRLTFAAGAAGAADAVDIGLGVVGDVVIDHVADPLHVQPARRDIGRYQDVQ